MTIAEVSRMYDISADTLRYYEKEGLIPPVERDSAGRRNYSEIDCNWVSFVKCMRKAGISIDALGEYVKLFQEGEHTRDARKKILEDEREALLVKIADMQETLEYLNMKIEMYHGNIAEHERNLK